MKITRLVGMLAVATIALLFWSAAGQLLGGDDEPSAASTGLIAYVATVDEITDVYVMNVDGTNIRRLTSGPEVEHVPIFSPSGSMIAYQAPADSPLNEREIWTMNADGSEQTQLTHMAPGFAYPEDWSPDGSKIALSGTTQYAGDSDIFLINTDGTGLTPLVSGPEPEWGATFSPDGSRIAFIRRVSGEIETEVNIINTDGSGEMTIRRDTYVSDLSWSPSGEQIVFCLQSQTGDYDDFALFTMNSDGSNVVQITEFKDDRYPDWSSDGNSIVFSRDRHIYVMNSDGTYKRRLDFGDEPSWGTESGAQATPTATAQVEADFNTYLPVVIDF